jgi:hypothetical protein
MRFLLQLLAFLAFWLTFLILLAAGVTLIAKTWFWVRAFWAPMFA